MKILLYFTFTLMIFQQSTSKLNGTYKVIYDKESEIYYLVEVKDTDLRTDFDNVVKALIANENFATARRAGMVGNARFHGLHAQIARRRNVRAPFLPRGRTIL